VADSGRNYTRPNEGFRFRYGGMKLNAPPDALTPGNKYVYGRNIRVVNDSAIETRPGLASFYPTNSHSVTDLRAFAALNTDNDPVIVAVSNDNNVWTQAGVVGALSGSAGFPGAAMIPFRPAQSPNPWMYIANGNDYQKFSAPVAGVVTQQKVGIAEPQTAPNAASTTTLYNIFSPNPSYTHAGVAGAVSNTARVTDTVQSVFADPGVPTTGFATLGVSTSQVYTRQMALSISDTGVLVQDVYPAQPVAIGILAVYYFTGTTGRCIVVPANLGAGPGNEGQSLYEQNLLGSLRRGALIKFSGGSETCIVWSVTEGPDGTVCLETSTTGTHTSAETFTAPQAIQVNLPASSFTVGQSITSPTVTFALSGAGIGTETSTAGLGNPFVYSTDSFQEADYLHFSINVSVLTALNEAKLLFDVGDGSFTQNLYYYTVRVSDIEAGVQNTLTQLGAAQLVDQRATIDEETAAASGNQLSTSSSAQTTPGDLQWAEIIFPISALTRVGNDQTKTLQNVNAVQFLVNAASLAGTAFSYPINIQLGPVTIWGGYSPDVGQSGAPYLYRVRPRSSLTGAKGNPSPETRYGVNPRREQVTLALPSAAYDGQIDTWDVFRYGGSVTSWRWIGQSPTTSTTFIDNYSDEAALAGEELEFDNYEPWPSIDVPLMNGLAAPVTGFVASIWVPTPNNVLRWLPGTEVRIGGTNVYTLRSRPTLLATGRGINYYQFEFVENAGYILTTNAAVYEPNLARQLLPYMWGPDAEGTVFAVGDPLRPGTISFAKNYAPDSAPDSYDIEITPPTEPLLGGELLDGLSFVASTERWWALYPQPSNPTQRYSYIQQPLPRGLAAPWGHCTDGKTIWWWAKDAIWDSQKGSLTDADLYNLFPHDGVAGVNVTYNGYEVLAPDYAYAANFRLAHCNGYLYATYVDSTGNWRCLVCDTRTAAWSVDIYNNGSPPSAFYHVEQQGGTLLTPGLSTYPVLVAGGSTGGVFIQSPYTNDAIGPIAAAIITGEWDGGDVRAGEVWGDAWLDSNPSAATGVSVTPMSGGVPLAATTVIAPSASRTQTQISLGGGVLSDFLGLQIAWTDNFTAQGAATRINIWQPSFIQKPETITDRYTDWYDGGTESAKYIQGFLLHADTFNALRGLQVRDSDTLTLHPFTPVVQHNGESIIAYSFVTPFIAHTVRLEPSLVGGPISTEILSVVNNPIFNTQVVATVANSDGFALGAEATITEVAPYDGTFPITSVGPGYIGWTDPSLTESYPTEEDGLISAISMGVQVPWRFFGVEWVFESTPEAAETWQTQGTAFGLLGYMHVKQVSACYAATEPVTLTVTCYGGQQPMPITLPSTGGVMAKLTFILTANKGVIYFFSATSTAPFQLFLENWEIWVGGWSRTDNYLRYRSLGGATGDQARI